MPTQMKERREKCQIWGPENNIENMPTLVAKYANPGDQTYANQGDQKICETFMKK